MLLSRHTTTTELAFQNVLSSLTQPLETVFTTTELALRSMYSTTTELKFYTCTIELLRSCPNAHILQLLILHSGVCFLSLNSEF